MIKKALPAIFLLAGSVAPAQQISNVSATQEEKKIVVTYDLSGGETGQTYDVSLRVSEDGGSAWSNPLTAVSGDVGTGIKGGYGKQIIWDVLSEPGREKLLGDRIKFKIQAEYATKASGLIPEMVFIQGGTFQMGSNDGESDEKPVHRVTVGSFYLGKYEVTQKQWKSVMGSDPPALRFKGCENCPVESVSWNDVQEFIRKLNQMTGMSFRLPAEAEWEYAARGGNQSRGYTYSGSNDLGEAAWYSSNSSSETHPVGQKKPNELGLYDMSGNVWEWCSDWYDSDYYQNSPANNPIGPSTGSYRALRGGSWNYEPYDCRTADRGWRYPDFRSNSLGFRLCRTE